MGSSQKVVKERKKKKLRIHSVETNLKMDKKTLP